VCVWRGGGHFSGQEYELRINDWGIAPLPSPALPVRAENSQELPDCAQWLKISYVKDKTGHTNDSESAAAYCACPIAGTS
jgi:hypothetical protein